MASNYKATLVDESSYERWKEEVELWQTVTSLDTATMAPAICLALSGRPREAVLELDVASVHLKLLSF